MSRRIAMSIAGSDPSGGAGIQADLKTFTALGVYGAAVVTALTVQNTVGVRSISDVSPELVLDQIAAVLDDLPVDAVKIGMLGSSAVVHVVAELLERRRPRWLIVDPVMVATSGDRLLDLDAVSALASRLGAIADLLTPNLDEVRALTQIDVVDRATLELAARAIIDLGVRAVLVKGGHLAGDALDLFFDGIQLHEFTAPRIGPARVHGAGCTLSAAIAARLARGDDMLTAIARAKQFVHRAIEGADSLGAGATPLDHCVAVDGDWR